MDNRRKIIVGAWKAYLKSEDAEHIANELKNWKMSESDKNTDYDIVLSPSFPYLIPVRDIIKETDIALCAQDVDPVEMGAYTGHIPPQILLDVGCDYVLLGHSELRHLKEHSKQQIHDKVKAALKSGLRVILCIGETIGDKNNNKTRSKLKDQLESALEGLTNKDLKNKFDVAYEPTWAISSQSPVDPPQADDINEIHDFIRKTLNNKLDQKTADTIRVLYGGSVNENNVCNYLHQPLIDGVLVGSASTKHPNFIHLLRAVEKRVLLA